MGTRRSLPLLVICLLLAALIPGALPLSARTVPPDQITSLPGQTADHVQLSYHSETGKVRFMSTDVGYAVPHAASLSADAPPEQAARQFLASYGSLFGLRDQAQELTTMRSTLEHGRSFVRFQQRYQGIPVLGGELIVQVDQNRNIVSANGEILPDLQINTTPRISAAAAQAQALAAVARDYAVRPANLTATTPQLWIFNQALLGGPGLRYNALTWRTEVRGVSPSKAIREFVLVDAHLGAVALHFNQLDNAKERHVCNGNNVEDPDGNPDNNCTPAQYVRSEGQAATGNTDVDLAYDFSGATYDFFKNRFNRDSLDGAGFPLISLVKYCPSTGQCPYVNAFWDGHQMTYGDGFASADDVVAHELSHGLTEFTSGLLYFYQSGAINESMSDVFGELIDLTDGRGDDSAGVRWLLGEDLSIGAIRNMQDPTTFNHPDRTGSPNYTAELFFLDNGGVHTNSGVNNKAAFLMTDGGTFNGQTITGLGITKVARIYYVVETSLLTAASDYQDLGDALRAACNSLIGTIGITAANCAQVNKAVLATQMDTTPANAPVPAKAPVCSSGQPNNLFFDDLENPASGTWTSAAAIGNDEWYYPPLSNPYDYGGAAQPTSGQYNFWGYDQGSRADYHIRMTSSVALPAASTPYLRFNHAYRFEQIGATKYDGGVIEYSTNGGTTWNDAGPLIINSGYNGTLTNSSNNPLAGRPAFTGDSFGYTASRLNLSSLAGQSVRFRFRIGTDSSGFEYGWWIDDVQIYTCGTSPAPQNRVYLPAILKPAPQAPPRTRPGFWQYNSGDPSDFYVTPNGANVVRFTIRHVYIPGECDVDVTYVPPVPIFNNHFSLSGEMFFSGTFNSATTASGTLGLDGLFIPQCDGYISGGPFSWTATWRNNSQPSSSPAGSLEITIVGSATASGHQFGSRWRGFNRRPANT